MNFPAFLRRPSFGDGTIALCLGTAYVLWLLSTASSIGFARDEGFYFHAAQDYARWFRLLFDKPSAAFERSAIDSMWGYNHEHPALMKSLFALSWMFLHEKYKVFHEASTAFRFPAMVMAGVLIGTIYRFGALVFSRSAGIVAAAAFALMPRVFYHSHLACFDIPIVAMWTLCIYVYYRSLGKGLGWAIACGLIYGLTLETKHNAWILPFVFVPHAAFVMRKELWERVRKGSLPIPSNLLAMALVGPLVFYALWPWIWHDTIPRLREYVGFHLHHDYYNMEFLGKNYWNAPSPRGYMPVMIVATVPTISIVLALVGIVSRLRTRLLPLVRSVSQPWAPPDPKATELLFLLAIGAAMSPWLFAKTPIFGGTKHWMTAYPFLCLFAGYGFTRVFASVLPLMPAWARVRERAFLFAMGALTLAAPLAVTIHAHPFALSSYVPFVGGARGGASLGLNRQFWGYTTQDANREYLGKHAPRNASVFIHDTAWDSWMRMLAEKRVRPDLRGTGSPVDATISLVHHELHMNEVDFMIWVTYGGAAPAHVVTHDGVPIVSIHTQRQK